MTVHRERPIDGEKVRRLRTNKWMNQGDLAQATGIALDTISRIETGQREYPRRSTIFALADALGVRPEELLKSATGGSGTLPSANNHTQHDSSRRAG